MPTFNWADSHAPGLETKFKIYQAITLLLTVSVLFCWWIFAVSMKQRSEKTMGEPESGTEKEADGKQSEAPGPKLSKTIEKATIAIEAKKDSSSMKTIAVLGMLFLPSTLVAVSRLFACLLKLTLYYLQSLFSLAIFSWGDNDLPVANAAFKYYWAITMPLTLLVILWAVVMLFPWRLILDDVLRREFNRITH
jgi:hypothetical protein